jgi:hypothetical protein
VQTTWLLGKMMSFLEQLPAKEAHFQRYLLEADRDSSPE